MKKARRLLSISALMVSMIWIEILAILTLTGYQGGFPAWIIWMPEGLFVLFVYCEFFWPRPRKKG